MAASYTWPPTLPQLPRMDGTSGDHGVMVRRTPMDSGPAKLRRRGKRPENFSLVFDMTTAQVATLVTFVEDTIRGTARYYFPHPRTRAVIEARLVPGDDGQLFSQTYVSPGRWRVGVSIEVLP